MYYNIKYQKIKSFSYFNESVIFDMTIILLKGIIFMKKLFISVLCVISILILSGCTDKRKSTTDNEYISPSQVYIVKEFEGKVAIFQQGNNQPIQILDCIIKDLPPDAVQALTTGIEVNSLNELQKIIEAYD